MREGVTGREVAWLLALFGTFALGYVGFWSAGAEPLEAAYRSLQLFVLEFPDETRTIAILELARFLAALLVGGTLLVVLLSVVQERRDRRRLARTRRHVVLIGFGALGHDLLDTIRRQADAPAVVVVDPSDAALSGAAAEGALTVRGDARDVAVLARAGIAGADQVIVTVPDWTVATEITGAVRDTGSEAPVLAHVTDLGLCHRLRRSHLASTPGRSDVFNLPESAARVLLADFDGALARRERSARPIVLLGGDRLGSALILQAARSWLASPRTFPLDVLLVGPNAEQRLTETLAAWPELVGLAAHVRVDTRSPMAFALHGELAPGSTVVVDLADEEAGVVVGCALTEARPDRTCTVVARRPAASPLAGPHVATLVDLAWWHGRHEQDSAWQLARQVHEIYRQSELAADAPGNVPWEQLPDRLRVSNHAAACAVSDQLRRAGLELVRPERLDPTLPVALATLVDDEVIHAMAAAEHDRWLEGRPDRTRHAVPWAALEPAAQAYNLAAVRSYPRLLLRLGYSVRRVAAADPLVARRGPVVDAPIVTRFRRTGEVRASRLGAAQTWTTPGGGELAGQAGDWLVDDGTARWTVVDEAFQDSYQCLGDGRFRRTGEVVALRSWTEVELPTLEGVIRAHAGDWLVRNELGHLWPVDHATFERTYEPLGDERPRAQLEAR